jgi:tetratricopeptide (TPR) repeat protein
MSGELLPSGELEIRYRGAAGAADIIISSPARPEGTYYRLALLAARRRDISGAALYARYALAFNPEQAGAAKLLELCRDELGELPGGENAAGDGLARVRELAAQKKWRAAEKAAGALPRQSVRILNIRGCLLARARRFARAADCFAQALAMDRFNVLAARGFAETSSRRSFPENFPGIWFGGK